MTHNSHYKCKDGAVKACSFQGCGKTFQQRTTGGGRGDWLTGCERLREMMNEKNSSYLSFWQTKRLKAFSAPRKLSSSRISTALIQLGLKSRAICWKTNGNGKLQGGAGLKLGCFMPPRELCIMHKHWRCWLWISPNAVNTDLLLNYET